MKEKGILAALVVAMLLLAMANLLWGSLKIPTADAWRILWGGDAEGHPTWTFIIRGSRMPQMFTALLSGAALSSCGLMLQTYFRNPLAGPSILGIDAGANLGVAIVTLLLGGNLALGSLSLGGHLLTIAASMTGALCTMILLLFLSSLLRSQTMLLITGILISYATGSLIALLNYHATEQGVHSFMMWGLGTYANVSAERLPLFCCLIGAGLFGVLLLIKPMDALLLGDRYAENLGISLRRTRNGILLCTGLLTATTTAFCGPISFLGLAVPHLARLALGTSIHRILLPGTILIGACLSLICNLLSTLPSNGGLIPINVLTPLIGAPVILFVILQKQ